MSPHIRVWRSVRMGGDTKTRTSRRTLALPERCVDAFTEQRERQAIQRRVAGPRWRDHDLVFASEVGTQLDAANVRRGFRRIAAEMVTEVAAEPNGTSRYPSDRRWAVWMPAGVLPEVGNAARGVDVARFNRIALGAAGQPDPADLHRCWAAGARTVRLTPRVPSVRPAKMRPWQPACSRVAAGSIAAWARSAKRES